MSMILKGEGESLEFKRDVVDIGKTVTAFANTEGGNILIGVDDKGNVTGLKGRSELQKISDMLAAVSPPPKAKISSIQVGKNAVAVVTVQKGYHLFAYKNIVYIRIGANNRPLSVHEIMEKAGESLRLFFDELTNDEPLSALNKSLVRDFLQKREEVRGIAAPSPKIDENILLQLRILRKTKHKLNITNGGLLFFGTAPQKVFSFARIHLVHFLDSDMQRYSDQRIFEGALWKIVQDVETYLRNNIRRHGGEKKGFVRAERFEYPIDAVREAILNAMVHRNYFDAGDVKVFIMPDRLVIKNPGSFPPGVTPDVPEHRPRNPLLAQYFYDVGLIEKYGSGIQKMRTACQQQGGINIDFKLRPVSTTVAFVKTSPNIVPDRIDNLILQRLASGPVGTMKLVALTKISRQAVIKRLNKLLHAGMIRREGSGAGVKYYI